MPVTNNEKLEDILVTTLRGYAEKAGVKRLTVGVSGGIDSAVVLALSARAVGPENVTAVYIGVESSQESLERAREAALRQDVTLIELELTAGFKQLAGGILRAAAGAGAGKFQTLVDRENADKTILGGFKSCYRAPILRYANRLVDELGGGGGIVVGTGNRDEDGFFRFFQKGGDGEVDCNILANLSKGEVRQLALYLGVPEEIVFATPTPDLWGVGDQHSDEEELSAASGGVKWTYTTITTEGDYYEVGTMEAAALWIDRMLAMGVASLDALAAGSMMPPVKAYGEDLLDEYGITKKHIASILDWERKTRHKLNSDLPAGPTREQMISAGAITDKLR